MPLGAGALHSALLFVAFYPVGFWPAALVAVAPLLWLALRWPRMRWRDLGLLFLGVALYWIYTEWWILDVSWQGFPFLVAIESAWAPIFVWALGRCATRFRRVPLTLLVPVLWTGIEFCRGELFADGYAWSLIAYPLIDAPRLAAFGHIGGVYGVGFLVALLAGAGADQFLAPTRRRLLPAAALLAIAACGVWAWFTRPRVDGKSPSFTVAAIQTNVPQSNKVNWTVERELVDWKRFEDLTRKAVDRSPRPDMVLWPETMMPGMTLEPAAIETLRKEKVVLKVDLGDGPQQLPVTAFADRLLDVQRELGMPFLIGETALDGLRVVSNGDRVGFDSDARYNSVYLVRDGRVSPVRYDKMCLTPFGETMPYISAWPWLQDQLLALGAHGMAFDLARGRRLSVFSVPHAGHPDVRLVTPICFEVTVAPHCRRLVYEGGQRRADIIANVTNDGWFGDFDTAREQHLQIARWRSLELGTPTIRAANTGISTAIDLEGRVTRRGTDAGGTARTDGPLTAIVELPRVGTIYGRFGDVVGWSAFVGTAGLVLVVLFRRREDQAAEAINR